MWGDEQIDGEETKKIMEIKERQHYSYKSQVAIFCLAILDLSGSKNVSLFRPSQERNPLLMLI